MNTEVSKIGGLDVEIVRKKTKNIHIGRYPPDGRVRVAAPANLSDEAIRIAVLPRMQWISRKQRQFLEQERQTPRRYVSGETHFLYGRPLRLDVVKWDKKVHRIAKLGSDRILIQVPRESEKDQLRGWLDNWKKTELRKMLAPRVAASAARLGVGPKKWGIRRMKTKWGSCNPNKAIIWLNSEMVKKPERMIDDVIAHELAHLVSTRHEARFIAVLDEVLPRWREVRKELNALPLPAWEE